MGDGQSLLLDSADPALIFLDSAFRVVSYNQQAVRILGRSDSDKNGKRLFKLIEDNVRQLLSSTDSPNRTVSSFQCGNHRYNVRLFALTTDGSVSLHPTHALLLERSDRTGVDVSFALNLFRLTPRERETLEFLMQGMTSKEIASHMGVSPHTVKAFLRLVMSKMQVSTRSGIIGKLVSANLRSAR
jgi:DNA-binding CsgD family transcriptional regulator